MKFLILLQILSCSLISQYQIQMLQTECPHKYPKPKRHQNHQKIQNHSKIQKTIFALPKIFHKFQQTEQKHKKQKQTKKHQITHKNHIILFTNTSPYPWTMVVKFLYTKVTNIAVTGSWGSINIACPTILDIHIIVVDDVLLLFLHKKVLILFKRNFLQQ